MIPKYLKFLSNRTKSINEVRLSKMVYFRNEDISSKFTTSIEIEMETKDMVGTDSDYDEKDIPNIVSLIRNSTIKDIGRMDITIDGELSEFLDNIFFEIENDYDDYDYILDDILSEKKYKKNKIKSDILSIIRPMVINYFFSENFSYLRKKIRSKLPNFYKKWKSDLKFELDNTLKRGIELSNSTYLKGINELIDLINSFYDDFETQNYWLFNKRTGIHINIGSVDKALFNPIKGILFLGDTGKNPFVFNNMDWRKKSAFCGSLKSSISESSKKESLKLLESGDISGSELVLNSELQSILIRDGYKNFGVNLRNLNKNYVEFRYPGGKIERSVLIEKILYFSYIYHLMTNQDFDKKEYHKKLYKFLSS